MPKSLETSPQHQHQSLSCPVVLLGSPATINTVLPISLKCTSASTCDTPRLVYIFPSARRRDRLKIMGSVLRAGRKLPSSSLSPSTPPYLLQCSAPAVRVRTGTLLQHNGNRQFTTAGVRRNDGKASLKRAKPPVSGRSKTTKRARLGSRVLLKWAKQNGCSWTWESARTCAFADLSVTPWPTPFGVYGVVQFLKLQPLTNPPGMEFNLDTMSLSVETTFPERLQSVQDFKSLNLKPYVEKALLKRAEAWSKLDKEDAARLESYISNLSLDGDPTTNNTRKRHYGMMHAHTSTLYALALKTQKPQKEPIRARWPDELGPVLSPSWHVHLNGMRPEDVQVNIDTHDSHGRRTLSCVWVSINAPLGHAIRDWESLAAGADAYTDSFTTVLANLARWLKTYWDKEDHHKSSRKTFVAEERQKPRASGKLPSLSEMVPCDHVVPVVLAYRQKYIWFLWSGGIHGKLVAQYASHWLPLCEANKPGDLDTLMRYRQEALMRGTNLNPQTTSEPDW